MVSMWTRFISYRTYFVRKQLTKKNTIQSDSNQNQFNSYKRILLPLDIVMLFSMFLLLLI